MPTQTKTSASITSCPGSTHLTKTMSNLNEICFAFHLLQTVENRSNTVIYSVLGSVLAVSKAGGGSWGGPTIYIYIYIYVYMYILEATGTRLAGKAETGRGRIHDAMHETRYPDGRMPQKCSNTCRCSAGNEGMNKKPLLLLSSFHCSFDPSHQQELPIALFICSMEFAYSTSKRVMTRWGSNPEASAQAPRHVVCISQPAGSATSWPEGVQAADCVQGGAC